MTRYTSISTFSELLNIKRYALQPMIVEESEVVGEISIGLDHLQEFRACLERNKALVNNNTLLEVIQPHKRK